MIRNGFCPSCKGSVSGSAGHSEQARAGEGHGEEEEVLPRIAASLAQPTHTTWGHCGWAQWKQAQLEPSHCGGSGEHSQRKVRPGGATYDQSSAPGPGRYSGKS